jgi:hypothetical protein
MFAKPQEEHRWLQQLVGEWTYEGEATMDPATPQVKFAGTESVRSIGGLWTIAEGRQEMPEGDPDVMITTLGYDPGKKRYVGTFIGSMAAWMWVYEGEVDASGKVLTLNADGPSFTDPGKMAKFRDVIEIQSDDERTLRSYVLGDDGKWLSIMTSRYHRKK